MKLALVIAILLTGCGSPMTEPQTVQACLTKCAPWDAVMSSDRSTHGPECACIVRQPMRFPLPAPTPIPVPPPLMQRQQQPSPPLDL